MIAPLKLSEKYRPATLSQIVGQRGIVRQLQSFVGSPFSCCRVFVGSPGSGKTSAALALVADLGCHELDVEVINAARWGIERAESTMKDLWMRPMYGKWRVLVLEELERLSGPCQVLLKYELENLPPHAIVLATSNDLTGLGDALLERFGAPLVFDAWCQLATGALPQLAQIWAEESGGQPMPHNFTKWGWHAKDGKNVRFSLRAAIDHLQAALLERECAGAA